MANLKETGGFSINGKWATRITYEADLDSGKVTRVELRFIIGGSLVAQAEFSRTQAREVLGDSNLAAIEMAAAERKEATQERIKGELRGRTLHYRQVTLPADPLRGQDNIIERESLSGGKQQKEPTGDRPQRVDRAEERPSHPGPDEFDVADVPQALAEARRLAQRHLVPEEIARRFLRVGNQFHFPDHSLAFVDRGDSLKAEGENPEIVRSLVAIAQARGWEAIRVNGTESFRCSVWREAMGQGLTVRGYTPTDVERAEVEREAAKVRSPAADPTPANEVHRESRQRGQETVRDSPQGARTGREDAARPVARHPTFQTMAPGSEIVMGRLVGHGPAPYQFDEKKAQSYFVRLETPLGPTMRWGVDLDRAFAASKTRPKVGDEIGVEFRGAKAVTIKNPVLGEQGRVISQQEMTTHRNSWIVEKREYFQQRRLRALAMRDEARSKEEIAREHPELAGALATVRLAELLASKTLSTAPDRTRFVTLVRDAIARAIEHESPLPAPMLRESHVRVHDRDRQRAKAQTGAGPGPEPPAMGRA